MTTLIPIHNAAMFHVDHVRCSIVVGARSAFHNGDADTSSFNSMNSPVSFDIVLLGCWSVRSAVDAVIDACCPESLSHDLYSAELITSGLPIDFEVGRMYVRAHIPI